MASAVALPLPLVFAAAAFPFPLLLALAAPFAFFSAAAFPLPFLAGAGVGLDLAAAVGLILDKRISTAVGLAFDGLTGEVFGALVGRGALTTSLYCPDLAGLAGVGFALTGVDLVGAAFPLTAFF